ncbi:MAG: hypothetical protein E5X65_24685 [Mesorhizobium sp.]|nr:MAG: hypothetical protein E5X65_24685 [Mesorhizobium sp.]
MLAEMEATSFVGIIVSGVLRMQKSLEDGRHSSSAYCFSQISLAESSAAFPITPSRRHPM